MPERVRRQRGEGAIYERSDGKWVGVVDLGYVGGKRVRRTVTATSLRELRPKFAALKRKVEAGVVGDSATVEQWLTHWLDDIAAREVKPRTLVGYRGYVATWLVPQLGRHRLDRLKPEHVRALHKVMEQAGKSDATRRQAHAILRRALVVAVREQRVIYNAAELTTPPPVGRNHHKPLTLDQARAVLAVLDGDPLAARWVAALLLGLRQGEALGLRWDDVDREQGLIHVRKSLQRIKGQGLVLGDPKSRTSKRAIPILGPMAYALDRTERRGDFVFYGVPTDPRADWGRWKALLDRAGVPDHPLHAARGTTASLLDAAGVSDKVISEILGHAQVMITRQAYIHGDEARHREAMAALEAYVSPITLDRCSTPGAD